MSWWPDTYGGLRCDYLLRRSLLKFGLRIVVLHLSSFMFQVGMDSAAPIVPSHDFANPILKEIGILLRRQVGNCVRVRVRGRVCVRVCVVFACVSSCVLCVRSSSAPADR